MGLHYQLENNELGLCFACGLVIDGGETGCVAYTEEGLEILRARGLAQEELNLFFLAYKLQHHAYFDIKEDKAIAILRTLGCYVLAGSYDSVNKQVAVNELPGFILQTAPTPIFMVQILQAATMKKSSALITQYVTDIWNAYDAFHSDLSIETNE